MVEFLGYLGMLVLGSMATVKIVDIIFDADRSRELRRRQAKEAAEEAALSDPDSPQSQKLRKEMDDLLAR